MIVFQSEQKENGYLHFVGIFRVLIDLVDFLVENFYHSTHSFLLTDGVSDRLKASLASIYSNLYTNNLNQIKSSSI